MVCFYSDVESVQCIGAVYVDCDSELCVGGRSVVSGEGLSRVYAASVGVAGVSERWVGEADYPDQRSGMGFR